MKKEITKIHPYEIISYLAFAKKEYEENFTKTLLKKI
jgi:hypothetical protein